MSPALLPPVIVAGYGRCGSSLVMQMLHAVGFPVTGDYPSFECEDHHEAGATIPQGASKVLNVECNPPAGGPFRWIWLDRHPGNQARSQAKMMRLLGGIKLSLDEKHRLARSYPASRPDAFAVMRRLGGPILVLDFELLIGNPHEAAGKIGEFVGIADVARMAAVVRKRKPECLPYLLESELIRECEDENKAKRLAQRWAFKGALPH